jgi:hypothetical protein|tara:strand:- start:1167 stop:3188 length:2022 start_codon:yes stop_codon:yes gene_type:complete
MAEKIALELDINAKGATTSLGQLEQEAERLNEELRKVPLGSKAFNDLKTELVGVNKEIKNTELSMEALDNEQVASELGSVAGAVGDVSAAFVLLGGGGGAIEDTVKNIEKAIGISMAFKGTIEGTQSAMKLFNNVVKNSTVLQKANNATTVIAAGIMKLFTGSVNTTSVAFKGLRTAIAATGIGLLAVGVGALVANFDKIKSALSGVSDAANDLQKATALRVETNQKNVDLLDNQTNILKLQGKTERQILKMKIDAQKVLIQDLIEQMKAQKIISDERIEGEKRNQKILQKTLELILIVPRTLTKIINLAGEGFIELTNKITQSSIGKKLLGLEPIEINLDLDKKADELLEKATKFIFDPEEAQKEADEQFKVLEENLLKQKNTLAGFQLAVINIDKKAAETKKTADDKAQAEADKKAAEARAKTLEERAKEAQDLADFLLAKEELENEYLDSKLSKEQQEINAVTDKYFNLLELARINGEDTALLEEAQQSQLNEIRKKYADEEIERQRAIEDAKLQTAADTFGSLIALNESFSSNDEKLSRSAFERNKKLQIGQALITTYQSANAAFAAAASNTVVTAAFPAYPGIMAGLAVAAGLANVNKIRKQKYQGGGGGGGAAPSGGVGGVGTAPTIAPANTSTLVPQNDTRVFVTETDITATQNQVAVIQGQATIR